MAVSSVEINSGLELMINLLVWPVLWFVAIFLHELGHAIMYQIAFSCSDWKIVLGSGRPIFKSRKLEINTLFFVGGLFIPQRKYEAKRLRLNLVSLGGSFANVIIILCVLAISHFLSGLDFYRIHGAIIFLIETILSAALIANVFMFIVSILPMTYSFGILKGKPSDGLRILRRFTSSKK